MHQLKILVTALALLVVTPVVAQEMGELKDQAAQAN
jgi:hypothetical protein